MGLIHRNSSLSIRHLTLFYMGSLMLIILFVIGGQLVLQVATWQQSIDGMTIDLANGQCILSQQISKDALALAMTNDPTMRVKYEDQLHDALILWNATEHSLQDGDRNQGLPAITDTTLISLYQDIKPHFQAVYQAGQRILSVSSAYPAPDALQSPFLHTILNAEPQFLSDMNRIVIWYQQQTKAHSLRNSHLQWVVFGLMLLFLLFVGLSLLRGARQYLRKSMNTLEVTSISLHNSETRYQTLIANAPLVLFTLDNRGIFTLAEGQGLKKMGVQSNQVVGRSIFDIYRNYPDILADMQRTLTGEEIIGVYKQMGVSFEMHMSPLHDTTGLLVGVIGVAMDVSERVHAEQVLLHQTYYDTLTNLPNRTLLLERTEQAIRAAEEKKGELALLMLGLDRFHEINDTFGHQQGDCLLQEIQKRLSSVIDDSATLARLGGDEFCLLLPLANKQEAEQAVHVLHNALEEAFLVEGSSMHVEGSIGIVLSPMHGTDAQVLLRQADVAMFVAKQEHKPYTFYDAGQDNYTPRRLTLLGALRSAITNGELCLFYQPQVRLKTGVTHSVEALVRWHHPEHGLIPPDQFIPLAEQTGLIGPLTAWVLEAAIQQCGEWRRRGIELCMAVNLSTWNLHEKDLPEKIAILLDRHGVAARYLCVEVTESAVMTDVTQTLEILNRIFKMGVRISVDDFGTGYSSLAYLKHLPIDELKIDRAFVQYMSDNLTDATIVQSTVNMGRRLGLRVVAEGVEDQEVWDMLLGFGCDSAQGYFMSRPLPVKDLEHWLQNTKQLVTS